MKLTGSLVVWLTAILAAVFLADSTFTEWVALGLILVAGVPHGAFDVRVAQRRWGGSAGATVAIISGYLLVGLLMSALCLAAPLVGLALFLGISALHFGEGEAEIFGPLSGALIACSAIIIPIALHPSGASQYLSFFVSAETFSKLLPAMRWVAAALLCAVGLLGVRQVIADRTPRHGWEIVLCLLAFVVLPPLSGFAVWFIGRHSAQHLARCRALFSEGTYRVGWDFIVISAAALLLLIPLWSWFDLTRLDELFAASIILIAGLTLPHMVVTHGLQVGGER